MLLVLPLFLACFAFGAWRQQRPGGDRVRSRIWGLNIAVMIPVAILYAACTIELDRALAAAFACGVGAWWLTVLAAYGYARAVAGTDRELRGALTMSAAFPNTGFVGFPLAHLAFGVEGLRIAVVYDTVGLVIPAVVVSTAIARAHARPGVVAGAAPTRRQLVREMLVSPPLLAMAAAITARVLLIDEPLELDLLGELLGPIVGGMGFIVAGLSLPLHGFTHRTREVLDVAGAIAVRMLAAPAILWLLGRALGIDVPHALLLASAMPTAVHALVIAREHDLQVAVVRLAILASTAIALVVVPIGTALAG